LNVVDDPQRSDFYFTAVHRAGDVTVSVSTEGASPALAQELRTMIARRLRTTSPTSHDCSARSERTFTPKGPAPKTSTGDFESASPGTDELTR